MLDRQGNRSVGRPAARWTDELREGDWLCSEAGNIRQGELAYSRGSLCPEVDVYKLTLIIIITFINTQYLLRTT